MYHFFAKFIPVLLFIGDYISLCNTRWYSNDKHEKGKQLSTVSHKHYCFLFLFFIFLLPLKHSYYEMIMQFWWDLDKLILDETQAMVLWASKGWQASLLYNGNGDVLKHGKRDACNGYWHETYIFGNSLTVLWWNNTLSFLFPTKRMEQRR